MANLTTLVATMRAAKQGENVRDAIADTLEAVNVDNIAIIQKQAQHDTKFTELTQGEANALASADAAADSEVVATAKAGIATTQAGISTTKATEAAASKTAAETAQGIAVTAKNDTVIAKTAAQLAETNSKASEVAAEASKVAAAGSAGVATTKAGESAASAAAALASEQAAALRKSETQAIKDAAVLALAETTDEAEVIEARKGKSSLGEKISDIDSQLAEKATHGEIFSMANMGQDVKTAMTGGSVAVVGNNTVLTDNIVNSQVTPIKTTFFRHDGKNLFNKYARTVGSYVDYLTGNLISNAALDTSDYILILPNTTYTESYDNRKAFYDAGKVFISGINTGSGLSFTTPANAMYVKCSMTVANVDSFQVELGNVRTAAEAYKQPVIPKENIEPLSKTGLNFNVAEKKIGKNLFNLNATTKDCYLSSTSGSVISSAGYEMGEYINVLPNTNYYRNYITHLVFLDANKVFISGNYSTNIVTTPANCYYVVISAINSTIPKIQFELGSVGTNFESFGYTIDYLKASNDNELIKKEKIGYKHPMGGALAMTCDGAYASQYLCAQILRDNNQHATFFIQNGWLDGLPGCANGENPLTSAQIVEMEQMGHEIGSHSLTHPNFTTLTEAQIITEFEGSITGLKASGIKNVGGFAYPMGLHNDLSDSIARRYFPYARKTTSFNVIPPPNINETNINKFLLNSVFFADLDDIGGTQTFINNFKAKLLDAKNKGYVISMYMHSLKSMGGTDVAGEAIFRDMCSYCKFIGLPVVTAISALKSYNLAHVCDWNFTNINYWDIVGAKYTTTIDTGIKFTGASSLKISPNSSIDADIVKISPTYGRDISAYEGQKLSVSFRLNIPVALVGAGVSLNIKGYYKDGGVVYDKTVILASKDLTTGWVTKSVEWVCPHDVYSIAPVFNGQFTSGSAYIDMLEVIDLDQEVLL